MVALQACVAMAYRQWEASKSPWDDNKVHTNKLKVSFSSDLIYK